MTDYTCTMLDEKQSIIHKAGDSLSRTCCTGITKEVSWHDVERTKHSLGNKH
jgi:hypothetical protein